MIRKPVILSFLVLLSCRIFSQDIELIGAVKIPIIDTVTVNNTSVLGLDSTNTVSVILTNVKKDHSIGDFILGGVVIWLDNSGKHGLICSIEDIVFAGQVYIPWETSPLPFTVDAPFSGIYSGETNTAIIVTKAQVSPTGGFTAAKHCLHYTTIEAGNEIGGWYLPSLKELELMYENRDLIDSIALVNGGDIFADDFYWSSTTTGNCGFKKNLETGSQSGCAVGSPPARLRAIRSF